MRYLAMPSSNSCTDCGTMPQDESEPPEQVMSHGFDCFSCHAIDKEVVGPAWIAIADPMHPWPNLPSKSYSAGPFYLVWEHPKQSGVTSEEWPYALASLSGVSDPLRRWPQLSIAANVPADDPSRRGLAVFLVQCLPCHRLYGAGAGAQGPDLGSPMPATAYMTQVGLKALLRDPSAVRKWPGPQMPSFDPDTLPDSDIDAVIAYLTRITEQRR